MIAGIGCRSGVTADQVEAAIDAAIDALQPNPGDAGQATLPARLLNNIPSSRRAISAIATPAAKADEPGIKAAAASRGVPLMLISQAALEAANPATVTRSQRSMATMNVHSVAEAAALAGAAGIANAGVALPGAAGLANTADANTALACALAALRPTTPRLLAPRVIVGPVTCALAAT
jgi:cobalt-precorrin 5A hydrolase